MTDADVSAVGEEFLFGHCITGECDTCHRDIFPRKGIGKSFQVGDVCLAEGFVLLRGQALEQLFFAVGALEHKLVSDAAHVLVVVDGKGTLAELLCPDDGIHHSRIHIAGKAEFS